MKISVLFGTLAALLLSCISASAQVIVSEDFESYANSAALYTVWAPSGLDEGILIDETYIDPLPPVGEPDDTGARAFTEVGGGQGVEHLGGPVLEYVNLNGGQLLAPTASKNLVLQGDIFDTYAAGNKRMSIGLRNNGPPAENLVELGQYNTSPDEIGYAYRAILFPSTPELPNPNWAFFDALPSTLDRPAPDDDDEVVSIGDIGEVWSTYRAIIGVDTITYEIDLFRDGLTNVTPTTGTPGVDMSITVPNLTTTANGYSSLRIGGPSNVSSAGGSVVFDNISLELVDIVVASVPGDFNGNGSVDAADYSTWLDNLGSAFNLNGNGDEAGGSAGVVDQADYDLWKTSFGNSIGTATSNTGAVPEPTSLLLACFASLALSGLRRRV